MPHVVGKHYDSQNCWTNLCHVHSLLVGKWQISSTTTGILEGYLIMTHNSHHISEIAKHQDHAPLSWIVLVLLVHLDRSLMYSPHHGSYMDLTNTKIPVDLVLQS